MILSRDFIIKFDILSSPDYKVNCLKIVIVSFATLSFQLVELFIIISFINIISCLSIFAHKSRNVLTS